jgi:hypothetical protein
VLKQKQTWLFEHYLWIQKFSGVDGGKKAASQFESDRSVVVCVIAELSALPFFQSFPSGRDCLPKMQPFVAENTVFTVFFLKPDWLILKKTKPFFCPLRLQTPKNYGPGSKEKQSPTLMVGDLARAGRGG